LGKLPGAGSIRITMTEGARELWCAVYSALSEGKAGLFGAVVARGEAQTVRLAMIYALLDGKQAIDVPHLEAALAFWEYAEASAERIFGERLGNPVADRILAALQDAGEGGLNRTTISGIFDKHQPTEKIGSALLMLSATGRARVEAKQTGGRPVEMWFA